MEDNSPIEGKKNEFVTKPPKEVDDPSLQRDPNLLIAYAILFGLLAIILTFLSSYFPHLLS